MNAKQRPGKKKSSPGKAAVRLRNTEDKAKHQKLPVEESGVLTSLAELQPAGKGQGKVKPNRMPRPGMVRRKQTFPEI